MAIERTMINTERFGYTVPVLISKDLKTNDLYDLCRNPVTSELLPYLIVGYFAVNDTKGWYFSNARIHDELEIAVQSVNPNQNVTLLTGGQLRLGRERKEGIIKFGVLDLKKEISDNELERKALLTSFLGLMGEEELNVFFEFSLSEQGHRGFTWMYDWDKAHNLLHRMT